MGRVSDAVVNASVVTPASHIEVTVFKSQLCSQFQLPDSEYPGKQQVMTQVAGLLPPTWETLVEFHSLGFILDPS